MKKDNIVESGELEGERGGGFGAVYLWKKRGIRKLAFREADEEKAGVLPKCGRVPCWRGSEMCGFIVVGPADSKQE